MASASEHYRSTSGKRILRHSPPMRDMESAWEGLAGIARILTDLGIPYSLDGGTLLGFVREGWFFEHDYDIDITLVEQHKRLLDVVREARRAGFRTRRGVTNLGPPERTRKLILTRGHAKVDIVSKRDWGGMSVWTLLHDRLTLKSVPTAFYEDLASITVRDVPISVPMETEEYLTARFGRDWRTPVLAGEWDKFTGDRAYPDARNTGAPLPESFPAREALARHEYRTLDSLDGLTLRPLARLEGISEHDARLVLKAARRARLE